MKESEQVQTSVKPKVKFFTQLGQDLLFYFNKRRTVRNAQWRMRYLGLLYTTATICHLYFYVGSSERFMGAMKKEGDLIDFTPLELTKEEYETIYGFYMGIHPR